MLRLFIKRLLCSHVLKFYELHLETKGRDTYSVLYYKCTKCGKIERGTSQIVPKED